MTERQKRIWDLLEGYEYLSSGRIGELLHISDRTVRNDMKEINLELKAAGLPGIESRKGLGYYRQTPSPGALGDGADALEEEQDLSWEVVRSVLFQENQPYLELADELYISESGISKLVSQLNREMKRRWKAAIIRKQNGMLFLDLTEREKRQYYTNFMFMKNLSYYFTLENYQQYFEYADVTELKQWVMEGYRMAGCHLYDATLVRIIIGAAVMVERLLAGFMLKETLPQPLSPGQAALHIRREIEDKIGFDLPPGEWQYLVKLFRNDFYYVREEVFHIDHILNQILIEIQVEYGFDFSRDPECQMELKAQLNGLLNRSRHDQQMINPVLLRIKSQYPLEYDISIFFADRFKRLTGEIISEDEIGMITVHFIRAMETNLEKTEYRVALINPFGKQIKELMAKRLKETGECQIRISHIYSIFDYPKTMPKDILAVLTTVSLPVMPEEVPVILCKNFLDYREKERLLTVIRDSQVSYVKTYFKTLFKPSLFFTDMDFDTKEKALGFMSRHLTEQGYVEADFFEKVIQREQIAPTAFEPGFAFAHGMDNTAKTTAICICVLKNKLAWGDYDVKIIFLFALASSWNHTMIPVYNAMIDNLFKSNTIKKLSRIQTFPAFLELLI